MKTISFKFSRAEKECTVIEREIQEAKEKLTETQKRVTEHQKTVASLDGTINEIKIKCGRFGKVRSHTISIKHSFISSLLKELRDLQLIEAPNDSNIDDCENELDEYDTRIETIKERIKNQKSKSEVESPEYRQVLDELAQARKRVMEKREEAEQCKTALQTCDALKENGQRAINELQKGLDDNQRKLEQQEASKKFIETKLENQIKIAEKLCKQRPRDEIDVKTVKRSLDTLLKFIETNKNM